MKAFTIFMFLFTLSAFPQNQNKSPLFIAEKTIYRLDKDNNSLPVWIAASGPEIDSVHLYIPDVIGSDGRVKRIRYIVEPSAALPVSQSGKLFSLKFNRDDLGDLDSGKYNLLVLISGAGIEPVKESLSFEIIPRESSFAWMEKTVSWIQTNFFLLLLNIFEIILLLLLLAFLIKQLYQKINLSGFFKKDIPVFKQKNSLNVLPIINETGKESEYKGVALGIDDILMYRLQEISKLGSREGLNQYWMQRVNRSKTRKEEIQILNVVGGEFSMDLQKLGDVSIGPVKIPLGSISAILLKIFGGNYVSGALQQYGTQNKLVIRLERKPSLISFSKPDYSPVQYFEASWPSDSIKKNELAEGIPEVVEELSYKLILELSKDTGTKNWQAYKYFLEGYKLFSDYDKNNTRIDRLRDAVSFWRESIKHDPDYAAAHYNLGVAYDIDGNKEDAVFRYQKAIDLNPLLVGAAAHFNLARLYWEKYKDEKRTLTELEKAKQLNPNIPDIYNLEGLVYSNKNDSYALEAEFYKRAITLSVENPNPVFYYNLSVADFYLNRLDDAQTAADQAYRLYGEKEKLTGLLQTMGVIHYQKGIGAETKNESRNAHEEFDMSIKYYREGLLKEPENRNLLKGYRDALFKLKRINDGMRILKRLIRTYPEDPVSYLDISDYLKSADVDQKEIEAYAELASILNSEADPYKIVELLNIEGPSVKAKVLQGAAGCIINIMHSLQRMPDQLQHAKEIFDVIFTSGFKDMKLSIEAEMLQHYGVVLYKLGFSEQSSQILNKAIEIYKNENRFFDLAAAYNDLAKANSNWVEQLFLEYLNAAHKENELKNKKSSGENGQLKVELTLAMDETDKAFKEANKKCADTDFAFQSASFNYRNAGYFKRAVIVHLDNADFLMKAESYRIKGNQVYEWAKQECDKAIQLDHNDFEAFHVKGNTFYYSLQYARAIPEYEKSLELNYNLRGAHYCIGLCNFYMGEYLKAAEAFRTAIKIDPKYTSPDDMQAPDAYQRLAMSLEKLNDLDGAVKILGDAVNIHPDKVKYHVLLGQTLKKRNNLDEAAQEFRTALRLDRENRQKMQHIALLELADIYADNGADAENARDYIERAKAIIENLDDEEKERIQFKVENTEGWICFNQNQYEKAVQLLEKTLANFLDEPKYHSRLAYSYEEYADSFNEPKLKTEYLSRAVSQWEIISKFKDNSFFKTLADEKLQKLTRS
ncbi:MAG TPA: tetratricopeptide repeat protein [Ignavibacteriaceae bacterium]|nr:tetratricopeptide repeat protein [Ignavibacteriaceae bacterium]